MKIELTPLGLTELAETDRDNEELSQLLRENLVLDFGFDFCLFSNEIYYFAVVKANGSNQP